MVSMSFEIISSMGLLARNLYLPKNGRKLRPKLRFSNGTRSGTPTLKAAILLSQYGLVARDVPASGERLLAADVEKYISTRDWIPSALPQSPLSEGY